MDAPVVPGQFDDALEPSEVRNPAEPLETNPEHARIDDEILEWSEDEEEEGDFEPEEDDYEDNHRVEDEDWENAERDFTKQYNRLRQHVAVRTGQTKPSLSSVLSTASTAAPTTIPLPAINRPRNTGVTSRRDKTVDQLHVLSKFTSRLNNIDQPYQGMGVSTNRKGPSATANMKDKSDRATSEQVLDDRTRIVLFKMIGRGLIKEVNGVVSTGKEANVYHAVSGNPLPSTNLPSSVPPHLALKIYKTSILIFKDRDRYLTGEHRFRRGYSRHNPRKMVRLWAEKEMRNLKRLHGAGVRCPEPIEVRENVLVMGFLGDEEGWASPRLKDAPIPSHLYPTLYSELLLTLRTIFHTCKLVHADLSEYNILYHQSHLFIIDVGQSVEHDHPHSFDFLRSDLRNVEEYFGRQGVKGLGLRRAFEFVTREELGDNEAEVLRVWLEMEVEENVGENDQDQGGVDGSDAGVEETSNPNGSDAHEDAVFFQSWIPRSLNEVRDPERDVDILSRGEGDKLIYADTIGLVSPSIKTPAAKNLSERKKGVGVHFADEKDQESDSDSQNGSPEDEGPDQDGSETDEDEDGKPFEDRPPRGHRHEDKEVKKERKKAVKTEARERRQQKMPKAEKKRKVKASRR